MPAKVKTEDITIVLNKPKYPGNVGFVARCAKNMGIDKIVVVAGKDLDRDVMKPGWPLENPSAVAGSKSPSERALTFT